MKYVVFVIAIVYALLAIYACLPQWKRPDRRLTAILMTAGGLILILTAILCLAGWKMDWLLAIIGCLLIVEGAVLNGARMGRSHPKHYTVRFLITLVLVVGFACF
jgi:hypothetical protein